MPRTTPVGVTYLPNETLWGVEKPVLEVAPNHVWAPTGRTQQSGPVEMLEWKVVPSPRIVEANRKKQVGKALTVIGLVGVGLYMLSR